LDLLASGTIDWAFPKRTLEEMVVGVIYDIRFLPKKQQLSPDAMITKLLDNANWADNDYSLVEAGDVEISAVLWLFKLGPRGLEKGWNADKSTTAILMDEEHAWILDNVEDSKYEDKKLLLGEFADGICSWGRRVRAASAGGV
jgi:hypothetical protein